MHTQHSLDILREISIKVDTSHHHHHILYDLLNLIDKELAVYVEIGALKGSSAILALHVSNVIAISIDTAVVVSKDAVIKNVKLFFDGSRYTYIQGNSLSIETKQILCQKINSIDVLFIDGDHSYASVITDFELYSPLVSKGGFIVFDDYRCTVFTQTRPAVDKIVSQLNKEDYKVIGTLENKFGAKGFPEGFTEGNCFILKKLV
jgi:cephalosporin hydroxylase